MNWQKERDILIPRTENYRDFGFNDKIMKQTRNNILTQNNYTCRFCGGIYKKYLICSYFEYDKSDDINCLACHLITHLNNGRYKEINLYYSLMTQIDIVRKTVNYVIEHQEIPLPSVIDPNVKSSPISILEYISILNNNETIPDELINYKIFYTQKFNVDFIMNNYCHGFMFIDESTMISTPTKEKYIPKHIPSQNELDLFNKYFS